MTVGQIYSSLTYKWACSCYYYDTYVIYFSIPCHFLNAYARNYFLLCDKTLPVWIWVINQAESHIKSFFFLLIIGSWVIVSLLVLWGTKEWTWVHSDKTRALPIVLSLWPLKKSFKSWLLLSSPLQIYPEWEIKQNLYILVVSVISPYSYHMTRH